jgi:RNA polymerase sigma-70 factor (ECF subfamily)
MAQEHILNLPQVFGSEQVENQRRSQHLEDRVVELYTTMRPSLLSYAYSVVGSTGESEDLVQGAFLKLFDQLKRDTQIQNLRSWLYRVVHNLAIDYVRRKGSQESTQAEWVVQRSLTSIVHSAEQDLIRKQQIAGSLKALNERERHCLMLRAEGLSYVEIGDVLGLSQKSVSVYLARGVKKFGCAR